MMREGTNLHRRVSQWLSTRLGGVHKKKRTQRETSAFFVSHGAMLTNLEKSSIIFVITLWRVIWENILEKK